MAGTTTNTSIRMDTNLKTQADAFDISLNTPNNETIDAMLEAERIAKDPSVKGYTDLDELFADLKKHGLNIDLLEDVSLVLSH